VLRLEFELGTAVRVKGRRVKGKVRIIRVRVWGLGSRVRVLVRVSNFTPMRLHPISPNEVLDYHVVQFYPSRY
jgi:hypothetical protein